MKYRTRSKNSFFAGVLALAVAVSGLTLPGCGDRGSVTGPDAASKTPGVQASGPSTLTVREAVNLYRSTGASTPEDYLKDTSLSGTLTPVRDSQGQVIGWDADISGTHFEESVDYDGTVSGQQFVPSLPGLPWLDDDAELIVAYEDGFLPMTIDPDALQYLDGASATIDAPLSGTTWESYLQTRQPGRLQPGGLTPAKSGIVETRRVVTVIVHDPDSGEPLDRAQAEQLLLSRGWTPAQIDPFLAGEALPADHPVFEQSKDGELTVTLSASVEVEVSVPPFVSVTVTGEATLSGPASQYAEIAEKVADMATDLANKLATKIEAQLEQLKELIDGLIDDFIDWVAELLEGFSLGDLFGWF